MIKILIVDDEALERKAVTKILSGSLPDVLVAGEAQNGRIAIEMSAELQPDLIFMDIKMPGIDGVQAVKEIKKLNPGIRFIMVSAFNTFEYAKEVMQQGVKEYLLKPSSKQDILEAVERVSAEIYEERSHREAEMRLRSSLERAVSIAQKEWVASLIINPVNDLSFEEWGQLLGVEILSGYVMLVSLQPKGNHQLSTSEKQTWYLQLKNALKNSGNHLEIMVGPLTDGNVPLLFLSKSHMEKMQYKSSALTVIEGLLKLFSQADTLSEIKIGVGTPYAQAQELNNSYHEAVLAMQMLMKNPSRKYMFGSKQGTSEVHSPSGVLEIEKRLLIAIRQGEVNEALSIFDAFVARHETDASMVKKSFHELFVLVSRMLHDLGIGVEKTPTIEGADTTEQVFEKARSYLWTVVQHVQQWRNNQAKGMLHKAKEYIEIHYSESLTLEGVAEIVGLSPFYLSKLFKDRFGMTFIDYLTEVRITHAKNQLMDQGKSFKEICYAIGYKDPNYFSRVFKKQTGTSPTEFRKATIV